MFHKQIIDFFHSINNSTYSNYKTPVFYYIYIQNTSYPEVKSELKFMQQQKWSSFFQKIEQRRKECIRTASLN